MKDRRYAFVLPIISHFIERMEYKNGCEINEGDRNAIVYKAELAAFFHTDKFPIVDSGETITIDGRQYRESYITGFVEGQEYFKQNYFGDPYNDGYKADLFVQYNKLGHDGYEGWKFVKYSYPVYFSHEIIKKWGYYAGIVFEFENLLKKHPSMEIADTGSFCDELEKACPEKEYESLKVWFIKEGWCANTLFWRTEKKGAGYKSILAYYLRDLHIKRYTKRELSYAEIKAIALNTFGVKISFPLIKTATELYPKIPKIPYFVQ